MTMTKTMTKTKMTDDRDDEDVGDDKDFDDDKDHEDDEDEDEDEKEQGRIHGYQLRTGGQGRKCAFFHFSTRWLWTDGPTNGRTKPLIELRVRN